METNQGNGYMNTGWDLRMVTWMDLLRIGLKLVISDDHIHPKKTFYCEVLVFTKLILGVQGLDHSINGQT